MISRLFYTQPMGDLDLRVHQYVMNVFIVKRGMHNKTSEICSIQIPPPAVHLASVLKGKQVPHKSVPFLFSRDVVSDKISTERNITGRCAQFD